MKLDMNIDTYELILVLFSIYSGFVTTLYILASKLQDIMSQDRSVLITENFEKLHLSSLTQNWYLHATNLLEVLFDFKKRRGFYCPSFWRVSIWAICFIIITIAISMIPVVPARDGSMFLMTIPDLLSDGLFHYGWISAIVALPILLSTTIVNDYVNISMTRALIARMYGWKTAHIAWSLPFEIIIVTITSALLGAFLIFIFTFIADFALRRFPEYCYKNLNPDYCFSQLDNIFEVYGSSTGWAFNSIFVSALTSICIIAIYAYTAFLVAIMRFTVPLNKFKGGILVYLDRKKPVLIASYIVIFVFTFLYWPICLIVVFALRYYS